MNNAAQTHEIAVATALMYLAVPIMAGKNTIATAQFFACVATHLHDKGLLGYRLRRYLAGFARYLTELPEYLRRDYHLETSEVHGKLFTDYVLGQEAAERLTARRAEPPAYDINRDANTGSFKPWLNADKAWPLPTPTP